MKGLIHGHGFDEGGIVLQEALVTAIIVKRGDSGR
jgi:hypothetical protein